MTRLVSATSYINRIVAAAIVASACTIDRQARTLGDFVMKRAAAHEFQQALDLYYGFDYEGARVGFE